MMRRLKRLILLLLLTLSLPVVVAAQTPQQEQLSLSVFPAIAEFAVEPGESIEASLSIQNSSALPLPLGVSAGTLLPLDTIQDGADTSRFDAARWVTLEDETLAIDADELISVNYVIDVPEDAAPGGHYLQINVRPLQPTPQASDQLNAQIVPQISAIVLLSVAGEVDEAASLSIEDVDTAVVDRIHTTQFTLANSGNVHILAAPEIIITKDNASVVERFTYPPQLILPGTEKQLSREWLPDETGTYQIDIRFNYGSASELAEANSQIRVVIPSWQLIAAGTFGVLVMLLIIRFRHLPRVFDALRGRSVSVIGSYRLARKDNADMQEDDEESSYSEVIAELQRQRAILGLPERATPKLTNAVNTALNDAAEDVRHEELDKRTVAKTDELKRAAARKSMSTISEAVHEDTNSKTVVIQTGSTTIVREEPLKSPPEITVPKKIKISSEFVDITDKDTTTNKVKIKTSAKTKKSSNQKQKTTKTATKKRTSTTSKKAKTKAKKKKKSTGTRKKPSKK